MSLSSSGRRRCYVLRADPVLPQREGEFPSKHGFLSSCNTDSMACGAAGGEWGCELTAQTLPPYLLSQRHCVKSEPLREQVTLAQPRGGQNKLPANLFLMSSQMLAYGLPDKPYVLKLQRASTLEGETWWVVQTGDSIGYHETDGQKKCFQKILALCDSLSPSASALLLLNFHFGFVYML